MRTVVIYLGGQGPNTAPALDGEIVATIAADSGLHLADQHDSQVDLIVGDMDSVDSKLLSKYENNGTIVSRFSHEKNETDFELAIMASKNYVADSLVVVGGGGDRLDHLLSNVSVMAGSQTESLLVEAHLGESIVRICRPIQPVVWSGNIGDEVSIIPIGSNAHGVTTKGLKWELNDSTLKVGESLGISNIQTANEIDVKCTSGSLAVLRST
jgi:thiamine pyrophosphokinase